MVGNDICLGIQTASKHWRNSNVTLLEKLVNLEKDIFNAPFHCFGIHDDCADYFCSKETESEATELVSMLKSDGIFNEILNLCQTYFASVVPSLLMNYNNNKAESFNNLVAKYTGIDVKVRTHVVMTMENIHAKFVFSKANENSYFVRICSFYFYFDHVKQTRRYQ